MSPTDTWAAENERMLSQARETLDNTRAHPEDRRAAHHLMEILSRERRREDDSRG